VQTDNINFAALSSEELNDLKQFEKEFIAKYGNSIYLLAYDQKS
jgi:hypothetical protein